VRFRCCGFCCRLRVRDCYRSLAAPTVPRDHQRSSNTKTGVRSYHNPYHQGKGESAKHLAAHQEQDEHGKESQTARQDRSRKRLIDGLVHHAANDSRRSRRLFSRMRSKITMVSFIEYPTSVRSAAITVSEISNEVSKKAQVINTS